MKNVYRVVEFHNGKFAVQRGNKGVLTTDWRPKRPCFLDKAGDGGEWSAEENIAKCCAVDTKEEAQAIMKAANEKENGWKIKCTH